MNYPVAVIIPVYKNDTPQYVRPAIDSIIKQTYSCRIYIGEFYQFNLSSCIRQQNSLTAQFVSFSFSNLANIFYTPQFLQ